MELYSFSIQYVKKLFSFKKKFQTCMVAITFVFQKFSRTGIVGFISQREKNVNMTADIFLSIGNNLRTPSFQDQISNLVRLV